VFNEAEETLTIFAVNRDTEDDVEVSVILGGFSGYRIAEHIVMTNADLKAINDMANPDRVKPAQGSGARIEGERLTVTFPKLSWNVIRLSRLS
jgi:alpha-N-arabinofuranosidase